jgi:putative FmdB family regulatory protein
VPTYAYACTACDHRFEVRQSFTDPAVSECPQCAGDVRKLFNSVGIVFKGSGFYKTDSRAGNGGGRGSAKDSAAKDSAAKDSSAEKSSGGSGSGDKAAATAGGSSGSSSGSKDSSSAA